VAFRKIRRRTNPDRRDLGAAPGIPRKAGRSFRRAGDTRLPTPAGRDAEAAQRICEALDATGIEVFLDQSELRGGDAGDQKIRREILAALDGYTDAIRLDPNDAVAFADRSLAFTFLCRCICDRSSDPRQLRQASDAHQAVVRAA